MKNIIILLLVLLAVGGGWYYYSKSTKTESALVSETAIPKSEEPDSNSIATVRNLLDLINSNQSQQCTSSYTDETGQVFSGQTYVSANNMRSNYEMVQGEESITGSMIKNGDVMYIWGSNMPQGIKMKYDPEKFAKGIAEDLEDSDSKSEDTTPIDPNLEMNYDCTNWTPDQAVFTPPNDITFNDISEVMDKIQDSSVLEDICATCETLEGENRATCLEQLNCGN